MRVSLFVSTDKLMMGLLTLLPGQSTDLEQHPGDEVAIVIGGQVEVRLEDGATFQLQERDGFFFPEKTAHQYSNPSPTRPASLVFGLAPAY